MNNISELYVIAIKNSFLDKLVDFTKKTFPIESCALLIGNINNNKATVDEIIFAKNINNSTVKFSIDPEFLYRVYIKAEKENKSITGIFHSHPAESAPSPIDEVYMIYNPVVWIILGAFEKSFIKKENMKAYQYVNDSIQEVKLKIIDN